MLKLKSNGSKINKGYKYRKQDKLNRRLSIKPLSSKAVLITSLGDSSTIDGASRKPIESVEVLNIPKHSGNIIKNIKLKYLIKGTVVKLKDHEGLFVLQNRHGSETWIFKSFN